MIEINEQTTKKVEYPKNVLDAFKEMVMESVECEELKENEYYKELMDQHCDIWDKVYRMLSEEGQELMRKLVELETMIGGIELETLYEKSLRDGAGILKLLQII